MAPRREALLVALLSVAPFVWEAQNVPWRREWCARLGARGIIHVSLYASARAPRLSALSVSASRVNRDDQANYLENERILSLSRANLEWMFREGVLIGVYEPLSLLLKVLPVGLK